MKKYLIIILCLTAASVMATETAYVGLKLTGATTAAATNYKVRITEDNSYTDGYDEGADAEVLSLNPSNSQSVFLYALVGSKKCSSVYDDKIANLGIGIQTNRVDNRYTITFTSTAGRSLKFYDRVLDSTMVMVKNGTYEFEVNTTNCSSYVAGQNIQINDRFIIEPCGDEGDLEVCHINGNLEIRNNPFTTNIVIKDESGEAVITAAHQPTKPNPQIISLEALEAGRYTVEFNEGAEVFVIAVKPEVVPAP